MRYCLHDVLGDGACFFRSISNSLSDHFVYNDEKQDQDVIVLKHKIIEYLMKHPNEYEFCPYKKEIYTNKLYHKGYWGGEFEAYILSRAIPCNIIIISKQLRNPQEFIVDDSLKTIYIYFQPGHYQSVRLIHSNQKESNLILSTSKDRNFSDIKLKIILLFQIVGFYFMYRR